MKYCLVILLAIFIFIIIAELFCLSPIHFRIFKNVEKFSINSDVLIIGHRGAASLAPENTLASIKRALDFGVDRIEIDVHQTIDAVIILMHDAKLDRTTNGSGLIKNKTVRELKYLDAGSWFSQKFNEEKIPTLKETIDLVNGQCELIIEIKKGSEYYPNIEKNILKIIEQNNAEDWIIIHSFDNLVLETIHHLNPEIILHKVFIGNFIKNNIIIDNSIRSFNFDFYDYIDEYSINYNFANKSIIDFIQSKGKKINVWTVNNENTMKKLIALGVDGLITDNPNLSSKALLY